MWKSEYFRDQRILSKCEEHFKKMWKSEYFCADQKFLRKCEKSEYFRADQKPLLHNTHSG